MSGLRWTAVLLTGILLLALGLGVGLGETFGRPAGASALAEASGWSSTRHIWNDSARVVRDFPILGAGLGTFGSIYPSYKSRDETITAWSVLLHWGVEAGVVGAILLGLALLWGLARLLRGWARVGTADRFLAYGLIGTLACFMVFSLVHWSVQLPAVAVAFSAFLGIMDRWLAGGTDLFVERM